MGTQTTIYILGAFVAFLTLSSATSNIISGQSDTAFAYLKQTQLRNINTSVFNMLGAQVSANSTYRVSSYTSTDVYGGTVKYRVVDTLITPDTLIKMETIGSYLGETRVSYAYYQKGGSSSTSVPMAFNYAAAGGGNIQISGNSEIRPDGTTNANVHTNNNLSIAGSSLIQGFVTYAGSFSGTTTKVVPVSNPSSAPVTQKTSTVTMPSFTASDYLTKATTVYAGDLNLNSGTLTLGTKASPKIVYVSGNFNAAGNATVSGYGMVIVKGNVQFSGNINFTTLDPGNSTFGLYAEGNIQMSGNNTYYGQLYSSKDIQMSGNAKVYGSVTAGANLQMSGNNKVYYRSAASNITTPVFTTSTTTGRTNLSFVWE